MTYEFEKVEAKSKVQLNPDLTVGGKNYNLLLNYLTARLSEGENYRSNLQCKLRHAFAELHGINYDPNDKIERERRDAKIEGRTAPLPKVTLQFANNQIDDSVNSIMEILFPSYNFYHTTTTKDKLAKAKALASQLKEEAQQFKHYSEFAKMVTNAMRYNLFGVVVEWDEVIGSVPEAASGTVTFSEGAIAEGNRLTSIDPYNVVWDTTVPVEKVSSDGEFAAYFESESLFKLRKEAIADKIFGPNQFGKLLTQLSKEFTKVKSKQLDLHSSFLGTMSTSTYYQEPPVFNPIARGIDGSDANLLTSDNISSFLGESITAKSQLGIGSTDVAHVFVKLVPKDFGLSNSEEFETWYFKLIGNHFIVYAEQILAEHGHLPIVLATMGNDPSKAIQQSSAEKLFPFQNAASNLLNLHLEAQRKAIMGGKTFFNERSINMELVEDHSVSLIPVKMPGLESSDIRQHVLQLSDIPQSGAVLGQLGIIQEMAQDALPTRQQKAVQDLQRATQYQAQTAYHEGTKKQRALARLIDNRALIDVRSIMFFNELQFRTSFTGMDDKGQPVEFPVSDMVDVQFSVSQGLHSIDKFTIMAVLGDAINFAIQAQLQSQGVDVLALIDHYTSVAGDETDLSQFRLEHQLDGLPTEVKDQLLAQLQQAQTGNTGGAT